MHIDWPNFTPWSSLAGGVLIGLAAILLMMTNGRIAGISGIVGGLLRPGAGNASEIGWRAAFVLGLVIAPTVWLLVGKLPSIQVDANFATLAIAGLLVGIGTRYGAGCTSGHGICGLSRLSPRSLAAVVTFMVAGFATVFIVRHWVLA